MLRQALKLLALLASAASAAPPVPPVPVAVSAPSDAPSGNRGLCQGLFVLDQAQLNRLAADVKEAFPARDRPLLDAVALTISPDILFAPYTLLGGDGAEIVIPRNLLNTYCILSIASMMVGQSKQPLTPPDDAAFAGCLDPKDRNSCFINSLGAAIYQQRDETAKSIEGPIIAAIINWYSEQMLKLALAHEYGHVLLDRGRGTSGFKASADPELAADMEALNLTLFGRTIPMADSMLFGGYAVLDHLNGPNAGRGGPHDASVCRAMRSSAMRRRLQPEIQRIQAWRGRANGMEEVFVSALSGQPGAGTAGIDRFAGDGNSCNLTLPPQILALESDLKTLAERLASLPPALKVGEAELAPLRKLRLRTPLGQALLRRLLIDPAVGRLLFASELALIDGKISDDGAQIDADLRLISAARPDHNLSSGDLRQVRLVQAIGQFVRAPKGSSLAANARHFQAQLAPLRSGYGMDSWTLQALGMADFLAQDCTRGFATFDELDRTLGALEADVRRVNPAYTDVRKGRMAIATFAEIGRAAVREGRTISPAQCAAGARTLGQEFIRSFGWTP